MKEKKLTDSIRLKHILESINNIKLYCKDVKTFEEFDSSVLLKTSCEKWIEEIGEASHHLSVELIILEIYNA